LNRKICFVGTEITPSEGSTFIGGHVNTVVGLCKGLSELGWEIHVVTTPSRFLKGRMFDFPWAKFHLINPVGKYNSLTYVANFLIKAERAIKVLSSKHSFDLVHGHSGYFGPAIIPAAVKRSVGIPAFFSLYCPASLLPNRLPLDRFGIKAISLGLDKVIAVTANVKRSLTRCGINAGKIEVLHSCYDEKAYCNSAYNSSIWQEESKEDPEAQKILFVGNVDKTKGLDIFLAAARLVLQANPKTNFIITLHEPDERLQSVKVLASCRLGASVKVLGVVSDMARLMSSVDVVVAPFRSTEGISDIPIIVLEAMALGKPVVASNLEGIKEAIQHGQNGIIVDLTSPGELANAITSLLDNPTLSEEISSQAILGARRFSSSEISRRLSDLYLEVLEAA
jgi:glycosyltransferase involved in cell wall biosynthesis